MNSSQKILFLKLFAIFGMLGPCIFFTVITVLDYLWPDYNSMEIVFSALGAEGAPHAIIMNIFGFGFLGTCIVLFSFGLFNSMKRHLVTTISIILLISSGILIVILIFVPCDMRCVHLTMSAQIHRILTYIASFFIPIAIILLTYPLKLDEKWKHAWLYFPVELVIFLLIVIPLTFLLDFYKLIGLMQRISMAVVLFWIFIISIQLYYLIQGGKIT